MANKLKYDWVDKLLFTIGFLFFLPGVIINFIHLMNGDRLWWAGILLIFGGFVLAIAAYRINKKAKKLASHQTQPVPLDEKEKRQFINVLKIVIIAEPLIFIGIAAFTLFFPFNPTGQQDMETFKLLRVMPIAIAMTTVFIIILAVVYFKRILPKQKKELKLSPLRVYFMVRVISFAMISGIPFIGILLVFLAESQMTTPPDWIYWYYMGIPVSIIAGVICWPRNIDGKIEAAEYERKESQNA